MPRPRQSVVSSALSSATELPIIATAAAALVLVLLGVGGATYLSAEATSSDPERDDLREEYLQRQELWLEVRAAGPEIRSVDLRLRNAIDGLVEQRVVDEPSALQAAREAEEPESDAQVVQAAPEEPAEPSGVHQQGTASWYGPGFAGNTTANGETYDPSALTAAHPSLPFGTMVRVTNQNSGQSVTVRINDRGPFVGGRIIDLSEAAADAIGMRGSGTAPVTLELTG